MRPPCEAINPCPRWNVPSAASRRSTFTSGRCITGWPIGSARTSFCACWLTISNGTCDGNWRHCYSTIRTRRPPRRYETASWPSAQRSPAAIRKQNTGSPRMDCRCTAFGHCSPISRHWRATPSSPPSRRAYPLTVLTRPTPVQRQGVRTDGDRVVASKPAPELGIIVSSQWFVFFERGKFGLGRKLIERCDGWRGEASSPITDAATSSAFEPYVGQAQRVRPAEAVDRHDFRTEPPPGTGL